MEFRVSIFLNQVKHKRVPKGINWLIALIAMVVISHLAWSSDHSDTAQRITVAAYYFANFHPNDPRNEIVKGKGWSEWELVKEAKPRFPGEHQPNVPLWGYGDESDPKVMAQKIDAAADHGINVFIFDWYYYNDGPFLDSPLDKGFLKASNNNRIKFALMWANHNWSDIHPYTTGTPKNILYPGKVTPATFERICDHVIKDYFLRPTVSRIFRFTIWGGSWTVLGPWKLRGWRWTSFVKGRRRQDYRGSTLTRLCGDTLYCPGRPSPQIPRH
jgi:hypothetical protein